MSDIETVTQSAEGVTQRVAAYLPEDLAKRLKIAAIHEGVSFTELIRLAVEQYLKRAEKGSARG